MPSPGHEVAEGFQAQIVARGTSERSPAATEARLFRKRGLPAAIRSDNGSPFASPNGLYNPPKFPVFWLRLGIKEVDDGIWLVSFMHYDPGYIDLEQRTLQTIDNPFGTRLSPMSLVRSVTHVSGLYRSMMAERGSSSAKSKNVQ